MKMHGRDVVDIELDDVDSSDYPDFCDAYVSRAVWADTGVELSEHELEELMDECSCEIHSLIFESLIC